MADPAEKPDLKADGEGERERSTIEFPYMDLGDAIAVSAAIHKTCGSSVCQHDQLAAELGLSMNSSGFRTRLSTARTFGLIETDRAGGGVRLTQLGEMIVDDQRAREAKAKAFLAVPLYKAVYELYRGKVLPPAAAAIERQMADLGVAQKQTGRARQAFERSAQIGGYFEHGKDRLVAPAGLGDNAGGTENKKPNGGSGGGGGGPHLHLMVQGLLTKLPPPDTDWPVADQARWLQTAASIFGLIYKSDGKIKIEVEDEAH
ncbi:MAG: hypothetical protein F9K29_25225 [Hyphomicrobiaceae bacterium]|nr:MAG: hypothetical protein F9K29_25225 [Hyphomicrobiaceae bacterium]